MNTSPNDFKKFYMAVPWDQRNRIWLFSIRTNEKKPDVPGGTKMKGNSEIRLRYGDAMQRLQRGANVGIYAKLDGLCFLDLDVRDGKLLASQTVLDALECNSTLTVRTRNGGIQKYYWNDGKYGNQIVEENGKPIGEFRSDWWYVVSVGSYVIPDEKCSTGSDGTYRIIQDHPISIFRGIPGMKEFDANMQKNANSNISEHQKPENQISPSQHLRDLMEMGFTHRTKRTKMAVG